MSNYPDNMAGVNEYLNQPDYIESGHLCDTLSMLQQDRGDALADYPEQTDSIEEWYNQQKELVKSLDFGGEPLYYWLYKDKEDQSNEKIQVGA